jgi:hypothetical protein
MATGLNGMQSGRRSRPETAENRVTSIAAEVLAAASSQARVSAIAVEALVSVAAPGVPTSSQSAVVVMVLGA